MDLSGFGEIVLHEVLRSGTGAKIQQRSSLASD